MRNQVKWLADREPSLLRSANTFGDNPFLSAVIHNKPEFVRYFLELDALFYWASADHFDNNCFMMAAAGNHCELLREMLVTAPPAVRYAKSVLTRLRPANRSSPRRILRMHRGFGAAVAVHHP